MGNPLAGVGGAVKNGANSVLNIDTWSLTEQANTQGTTSFGATGSWETNASTLKKWDAKCSGRLDPADTTGQLAFINGVGNTFTVNFYADASHYWGGSGILTQISPKVGADGLDEIEYSFLGSGACTFT